MLAEALHAAGGVPAKLLTDRMACLKGGVVANVVVPTPDYVRFAAHYGFTPDFCHAQDPQSKGIVENLVGYAQRDLVVPLLTDAQLTERPVGIDAANAAAKIWCAEVNARGHSEISAVPDQRLAVERKVLRPLPSLRLDIGPAPVLRKVDRLSCVRFASARYSLGRVDRLLPAVVVEPLHPLAGRRRTAYNVPRELHRASRGPHLHTQQGHLAGRPVGDFRASSHADPSVTPDIHLPAVRSVVSPTEASARAVARPGGAGWNCRYQGSRPGHPALPRR